LDGVVQLVPADELGDLLERHVVPFGFTQADPRLPAQPNLSGRPGGKRDPIKLGSVALARSSIVPGGVVLQPGNAGGVVEALREVAGDQLGGQDFRHVRHGGGRIVRRPCADNHRRLGGPLKTRTRQSPWPALSRVPGKE
jgi:hypothetical protein